MQMLPWLLTLLTDVCDETVERQSKAASSMLPCDEEQESEEARDQTEDCDADAQLATDEA